MLPAPKQIAASVTTRKFTALDYPLIASWWKEHGWPVIPQKTLPKTGIIALADDRPCCAGFLYKTDSPLAWIEWIVSNPVSDPGTRSIAIDALLDALLLDAKKSGFEQVLTMTEHTRLIGRLESRGFAHFGDKQTTLIKVLK